MRKNNGGLVCSFLVPKVPYGLRFVSLRAMHGVFAIGCYVITYWLPAMTRVVKTTNHDGHVALAVACLSSNSIDGLASLADSEFRPSISKR